MSQTQDQFVGKWKGKGVVTVFVSNVAQKLKLKSRIQVKLVACNTYSIKVNTPCSNLHDVTLHGFALNGQLIANAVDGQGVHYFYLEGEHLKHSFTAGTNVKSQVGNYILKKC